jgi:hypothetical protein
VQPFQNLIVVPSIVAFLFLAAPSHAQTIKGKLTDTEPKTVHQIKMEKGKSYQISMQSTDFDTYLRIQNADGKQLAFDDDGGDGLNSRLIFEPPQSATYGVVADAYQGKGRGEYTLTIEEFQPAKNFVRQGFPAANADPDDLTKSDTAWEIEWTITDNSRGSSVLAIKSAKFMYKDKDNNPRWIHVANNLQIAEMFVPYNTTNPTYYDISRFKFGLVPAKKEYLGPNCVAPGEVLSSSDPRMNNKVHKEVHDDGLRWLNGGGVARRGEQLMLWSILSAGNYRYIMEYDFKDDGIIVARVAATAHNLKKFQEDQSDVHLHVGCWRCDMLLTDPMTSAAGGADKNKVFLVTRHPAEGKPAGHFRVGQSLFNANDNGESHEGWADWIPEQFTTLRIESQVRKNAAGKATSYDLIPLRIGTVRDYPKHQEFINHDFWVTRTNPANTIYEKVAEYASKKESLEGQPVTIWHNSPGIHVPRGEDFGTDGKTNSAGVAIASWTGFTLRPRNLFDSTPLYLTAGKPAFKGTLKKDKQSHTYAMKAGVKYEITMTSSTFDTYLWLNDPQGKMVASDDDGGGGLNSRIVYTPTESGDFTIIAGSFGGNGEGAYSIAIKKGN